MNIDSLIKILQASIAPVVLISGVGLLLLMMTNRLGRTIDRIRHLCAAYENSHQDAALFLKQQIDVLYTRCQILRIAIALAAACIGCVSVIILTLFLIYIFGLDLVAFVECVFAAGIAALIGAMIFFSNDIRLALISIKIEIDHAYQSRRN